MASKLLLACIVFIGLSALSQCDRIKLVNNCPPKNTIIPCKCTPTKVHYVKCNGIGKNFSNIRAQLSSHLKKPFILSIRNLKQQTLTKDIASDLNLLMFEILDSSVASVEDDAFTGLENTLNTLIFWKTSLSSVPTSAISKLTKLTHLRVRKAKLSQVSEEDINSLPKSIAILHLSKNPITSVGSFAGLPNLEYFGLNQANLTTLPDGAFGPKVKGIDLMSNDFKSIPVAAFSNQQDARIILSHNGIKTIPSAEDMTAFLNRKNLLNIYSNPLECSCDLKWIPAYRAAHKDVILLRGKCVGDAQRKGNYTVQMQASDFEDCK